MAIYHLSAQMVKRSEGRSSIAMSAYRSAEKLFDEATEKVKDYTSKTKVFLAEILTPEKAPEWAKDRQKLWNKVEATEKRKDAQVARELNIALPSELSQEQMYKLANDYVQDQFVKKGMIADVAYHNLDGDNPHFHVMLTTRKLDGQEFGKKERAWNDKQLLKDWRELWAYYTNDALEQAGKESRVDHRTLEAQGIEREPQIHVGPSGNSLSGSVRSQRNESIKALNALRIVESELDKIEKKEQFEKDVDTHLEELRSLSYFDTKHSFFAQALKDVQNEVRGVKWRMDRLSEENKELHKKHKKERWKLWKFKENSNRGKEDEKHVKDWGEYEQRLDALKRIESYLQGKKLESWKKEAPERAQQEKEYQEKLQQQKERREQRKLERAKKPKSRQKSRGWER